MSEPADETGAPTIADETHASDADGTNASTDAEGATVADASEDATAGVDPGTVAVLRAENERLREQFRRAHQARYRRAATGFVAIGAIALLGAALLPAMRSLLVALGGTGVIGGLLTWLVTPEAMLSARIADRLHTTAAGNATDLIAALGLQDDRVYVPVGEAVRLFVPAHRAFEVPPDHALASTFVVTDTEDERGIALDPVGAALYRDVRAGATPADDVETAAVQLGDAVVELFELADGVATTVNATAGEVRFAIDDPACGSIDAFDHPIASVLAVGLAHHLDAPVRVDQHDDVVRCTWDAED